MFKPTDKTLIEHSRKEREFREKEEASSRCYKDADVDVYLKLNRVKIEAKKNGKVFKINPSWALEIIRFGKVISLEEYNKQ